MKCKEFCEKKVYMGRLSKGEDLLHSLTQFIRDRGIRKGQLEVIGAVERAVIGFYDQKASKYNLVNYDKHMEILSLIGNISLKDGEPFIHAHITLGDEEGRSFGGHLMEGTIVFAGEFIIRVFEGEDLERKYDPDTGLTLWDI